MADYLSINVQGIGDALSGLASLTSDLRDPFNSSTFVGSEVLQALNTVADGMTDAVRHTVPVDTGLLKSSIGSTVTHGASGARVSVFADPRKGSATAAGAFQLFTGKSLRKPTTNYGWYTELGTSKIPARHWFRNAIQASQQLQKAEEAILEAIRAGVSKALRARSIFTPV